MAGEDGDAGAGDGTGRPGEGPPGERRAGGGRPGENDSCAGDRRGGNDPRAGGNDPRADGRERRERSYRGISVAAATRYLERLGGEAVEEGVVAGDGWRATLAADTVGVGPTLQLTEVTVAFEGDPATLDRLVEDFSRKAMRAGG